MSDNALNFALGAISGVDNFLEQKEKTDEEIRKRQAEYEDKIKYYMFQENYKNSPTYANQQALNNVRKREMEILLGLPLLDADSEFMKGTKLSDLNTQEGQRIVTFEGVEMTKNKRNAIIEGRAEGVRETAKRYNSRNVNRMDKVNDQYGAAKIYLKSTGKITEKELDDPFFVPNQELLQNYNQYRGVLEGITEGSKEAQKVKSVFETTMSEGTTEKDRELRETYGDPLRRFISSYEKTYNVDVPDNISIAMGRSLLKDQRDAEQGFIRIPLAPADFNKLEDNVKNNQNKFFMYNQLGINRNIPYIKVGSIETFKKRFNMTTIDRTNIGSLGSAFFKQFTLFDNSTLKNMNGRVKAELMGSFERGINVLFNQLGFIDGGDSGQKRSRVNWNSIGMEWDNLPADFQETAEKRLGFTIKENEAVKTNVDLTQSNKSKSSVVVDVSNVVNSLADGPFLRAQGSGVVKDVVIDAVKRSASRRLNKPINQLDANDIKKELASFKEPNFEEGDTIIAVDGVSLVGNYFMYDHLYPGGNISAKINVNALNPDLNGPFKDTYRRMSSYAIARSKESDSLRRTNLEYDPRLARQLVSDMIVASISTSSLGTTIIPQLTQSETIMFSENIPLTSKQWIEDNVSEKTRAQANEVIRQTQSAYSTGVEMLRNLNALNVSGTFPEGVITLLDNLQNIRALGRFGLNAILGRGGNFEDKFDDMLNTLSQEEDIELRNQNLETFKKIKSSFANDAQEGGGFTIKNYRAQGIQDAARIIAARRMLHSALVFYTAAAFQGEGGKAISDGDRKFVEWALSVGTFTNVQQREAAIEGMLKIIAKAQDVNRLLASNDPAEVHVGLNYNKYHGENSIEAANWPEELQQPGWERFVKEKDAEGVPSAPTSAFKLPNNETDRVRGLDGDDAKYAQFTEEMAEIMLNLSEKKSLTEEDEQRYSYYANTYPNYYNKMLDDEGLKDANTNKTIRQMLVTN